MAHGRPRIATGVIDLTILDANGGLTVAPLGSTRVPQSRVQKDPSYVLHRSRNGASLANLAASACSSPARRCPDPAP